MSKCQNTAVSSETAIQTAAIVTAKPKRLIRYLQAAPMTTANSKTLDWHGEELSRTGLDAVPSPPDTPTGDGSAIDPRDRS